MHGPSAGTTTLRGRLTNSPLGRRARPGSEIDGPFEDSTVSSLNAVSAVSHDDVWAVGGYQPDPTRPDRWPLSSSIGRHVVVPKWRALAPHRTMMTSWT